MSDLDLFGNPITAPVPRVPTAKDLDDAAQISYRRYSGPGSLCAENPKDPERQCRTVMWLRTHGERTMFLCQVHRQWYVDREILDVPRG